ncbi:MAG: methylamine utilization protein [bacterium]|nr:methylamine utilization protein [bacterium]
MKRVFGAFSILSLLALGCGRATTSTTVQLPPSEAAQIQTVSEVPARSANAQVQLVAAQANTATLKAKFVLKGNAPEREKIDGSRDPFCAALEILSDKMVIGSKGEIQNLALYLDARRTKADLPKIAVDDKQYTLDNKNCMFTPHVIAARPGQSILVTNSDETGHNANFNFFNNDAVNFLIPAGGNKEFELKSEEPAPIPVECNIHPWMKAYIIVTEHPFVGVTNEQGELTIENLPVGEVTFKVWHESAAGSIDEGTVGGKTEKWSRGRMEIELKAGVNDLGTIEIDAGMFE